MTRPLGKRLTALEARQAPALIVGFAGMYDPSAPLEPRRFATFAEFSRCASQGEVARAYQDLMNAPGKAAGVRAANITAEQAAAVYRELMA